MAVGLRIRGLVQGVGFRPTVWHVAKSLKLRGDVRNDGDGVWVRLLDTSAEQAEAFCNALRDALPPLARIDDLQRIDDISHFSCDDFEIIASDTTTPLTGIVPDAATCPACQQEIFDPNNRRYCYPFTNCTHCGPRLSIIQAIPYDRGNTSMSVFPMCPDCEAEYRNPADRRYHAQPNACPVCGPSLQIVGEPDSTDPIDTVNAALREAKIVAIKGIGGFHLACDAHNEEAVNQLRQRKRRYAKPFALMASDMAIIERYCEVSSQARELLLSPAAPIVIMPLRSDAPPLPQGVAPEQVSLGFMLPYSPIHHLLLKGWGSPLVMTSGNLSDEPQCINNQQAVEKLTGIADLTLTHNRDIVNRVDDSVLRIMGDKPRFLRRARGYAPAPLLLHESFKQAPPILALGGELKNTVCLLQQGRATVSQHLGDLEDASTHDEFERTVALYQHLFAFQPDIVAVDHHPGYRSTQHGEKLASEAGCELVRVQHHHAHIASLMAESGSPADSKPALGIALDGLGLGDDGSLWGGEFLLADFTSYRRIAHLVPAPMPGATQAILEPWRNLWAQLAHTQLWPDISHRHAQLEIVQFLQSQPLNVLQQMQERSINAPMTSSAGRLFDAVAAALSLHHQKIVQEGQAAIALEQLALQAKPDDRAYPITWHEHQGMLRSEHNALWKKLFDDLSTGVEPAQIALRFHRGFAEALCSMAETLCGRLDVKEVALSGGVWQNRLLLEHCLFRLNDSGLRVLHHEQLPTNDGGLSLGQAAIAAARFINQQQND